MIKEMLPVALIGVGGDGSAGLSRQALEYIAEADQLWGSARLLELWPAHPAEKVALGAALRATLETLPGRDPDRRVVLLASGDPGFYGLGALLTQVLPAREIICLPQPTSLQMAFARIALPWNEAALCSAHARPLGEVAALAQRYRYLGILTGGSQGPGEIGAALLATGVCDCRTVVAENLCLPGERLIDTRLSQLSGQEFAPLNVLLVLQDEDWRPTPGLLLRRDEEYAHRSEMITRRDLRILALGRLEIRPDDVVWDIGAGSGAMSVEMAAQAWRGRVYAVERSEEQLGYIRQNVARFGALNVELTAGEAPAALAGLPSPGAVFIGGSGGKMDAVLQVIEERAAPGCRIVSHHVTLETLLAAQQGMQARGWNPTFVQAALSQSAPIASYTRLVPADPVFILSGRVPLPLVTVRE